MSNYTEYMNPSVVDSYNENNSYDYGDTDVSDILSEEALEELREDFICDELAMHPSDEIQEFLVSNEASEMKNKRLIGKKTTVHLSKLDDLQRRIGMSAIHIAKEKKDPLYDKLLLNRVKERQLLAQINKRYENPARKVAIVQQKACLKKSRLPIGYAAGK